MDAHSSDTIKDVTLRILGQIAPEADLEALDPDVSFREQLDIDSFDFLRFVIGVSEAVGVDVPEVDYPKLSTINDCVAYLSTVPARPKQKG